MEPGDFEYRSVRSNYLRGGAPGLVLRPHTIAEVSDAVGFARNHADLPLGVRSGGHGISGRSTNDGGIVIDLRALADIEVLDEASRRGADRARRPLDGGLSRAGTARMGTELG